MNNRKLSVGKIFAAIAVVLTIVSLILYLVNVSAAGYFQNAAVKNEVLFSVLAIAALVLALVIANVLGGKAGKILTGILQIAAPVLLALCLINLIAGRVDGLGYIFFSNADVALEVQTAENLASANMAIYAMVGYGVSMILAMITAFFTLNRD